MKYPDKFYIEIKKLKKYRWKKGRVNHLKWLQKNIMPEMNISRVVNDCRAGKDYKIINVKDYPGLIELELIRVDLKKNAK